MISVIPLPMTRKNILRLSLIVLLLPSLAACGLGYGKNPPDEFNVVRRAPLSCRRNSACDRLRVDKPLRRVKQGAELARLVIMRAPQEETSPMRLSSACLKKRRAAAFMAMGCAMRLKVNARAKPAKMPQ